MMWRRLLTRSLMFAASMIVASLVVFAFMTVLPGDPARVALGLNATDEAVAKLRAEYGLDRPWPVQYAEWLRGLVTFDPGRSYVSGAPIGPLIGDRLLVTLWLVAASMTLAVVVAVPLGTLMALGRQRWYGLLLTSLSQVGIAVPAFLAGILLTGLFAVRWGWLPSGGWVAPADDPWQFVRHLTLPAVSLALVQSAILARYVRSAMLGVLHQDYLRLARSKGRSGAAGLILHGMRNAAIPVLTVLGLQLSTLLVGAVVVERVFTVPGLGSLLLDAVAQRDLKLVQSVVMVIVAAVLIISYVVDLLYSVIDPRLRTGRG